MNLTPLSERKTYIAFVGSRFLAQGELLRLTLTIKNEIHGRQIAPILIFDDSTGKTIDIDTRGNDEEVTARLRLLESEEAGQGPAGVRGRGRPKLGVVAREVTLLPRHWDWLNSQAGGASVALRKLVEAARSSNSEKDRHRQARDAAYHFMSAMAGDFPGFEEAARALYANDRLRFEELVADWPVDIRHHAIRLGFPNDAGNAPMA